MEILTAVLNALRMAFAIFWEILWALILGFSLSAVVQTAAARRKFPCSRTVGENDAPEMARRSSRSDDEWGMS